MVPRGFIFFIAAAMLCIQAFDVTASKKKRRCSNNGLSQKHGLQKKTKSLACLFEDICDRAKSGKQFQSLLTLNMHVVSVHRECPYGEATNFCQQWELDKASLSELTQTSRTSALSEHIVNHHSDGCNFVWVCNQCSDFITLARTAPKSHTKACSKKNKKGNSKPREKASDKKISLLWCMLHDCEQSFQQAGDLEVHLESEHAVCLECFKKWAVTQDIDKHTKTKAHKEARNRLSALNYSQHFLSDHFVFGHKAVCQLCAHTYCFDNKNSLQDHYATNHRNKNDNIFPIKDHSPLFESLLDVTRDEYACSTDTNSESSSESSLEEQTEEEKEASFNTLDLLNQWLAVHSEQVVSENEDECDKKKLAFLSCWLKNLIHVKQLEDIKIFKPQFCCKIFTDQQEANEHLVNEHFICIECLNKNALFKNLSEIVKHQVEEHKMTSLFCVNEGNVRLSGMFPRYGDYKVCLPCVYKAQYSSQLKLEEHTDACHEDKAVIPSNNEQLF